MTMPQRRILYVVNAFERDAPTAVTATVARALAREGWTVAMAAWSRGGPFECELDSDGIITGTLHGARSFALAKWIREFQPDIVHSILVRPTLGTLLARAILPGRKFRWVVGDHGIHEWYEKGRIAGAMMNVIMPTILQVCDAVVTVSGAAKMRLKEKGIAPGRIGVVPNGVDPRVFYPRSRAERCAIIAQHFPDDDPWEVWPLIGSAGNLRAVKGFEQLVFAMPGILHIWPGARVLVWGEGPERERLEQLAKDFGIANATRFVGRAEHLEKLLPLLDLYVQPSLEESFGMAAAEAMCCDVPAIVSTAGGLTELSNHGRAARLFTGGQTAELARQVLDALDNKPQLHKEAAAGRGWILRNYTSNQMIARMKEFYDLLGNDVNTGGSHDNV